jgi:hypothetical protein
VSEQTLTPEQRDELARLASACALPLDYGEQRLIDAKRRYIIRSHLGGAAPDVRALRDTYGAYIEAACNAVPVLLAQLAAAERRAERAEDRAAVLTDRLNTATTDCSLLLGSLGLAEGRGSVVAAERDALRARVAELEAL